MYRLLNWLVSHAMNRTNHVEKVNESMKIMQIHVLANIEGFRTFVPLHYSTICLLIHQMPTGSVKHCHKSVKSNNLSHHTSHL